MKEKKIYWPDFIGGILLLSFGISHVYYNPLEMNLMVVPLLSFIGGVMIRDAIN